MLTLFKRHTVVLKIPDKLIILENRNGKQFGLLLNYNTSLSQAKIWNETYGINLFGRILNDKIEVIKVVDDLTSIHTTIKLSQSFCYECHKFSIEATRRADNKFLCEDCYEEWHNENYISCASCENEVLIDDRLSSPNGEVYCQSCFDRLYFVCDNCNNTFSVDESYHSPSDTLYCEDCFNNHCGTCASCNEIVWIDDLRYNDDSDEYVCESCYDDRDRILRGYEYKPDPEFVKKDYEHNALYIGFELEVLCEENLKEHASELTDELNKLKIQDRYYLKEDGSLNGRGFEIVSHPTTKLCFKDLRIKDLLTYLKENKYTSHDNDLCGLHFHISKKHFDESDIIKLKTFFSLNKNKILKISRRKSEDALSHYARIENYTFQNILSKTAEPNESRYVAVNETSKTIEFRIFRGTLNYESFMNSLNFILAVIDFIKQSTSIIFFNGKSWSNFIDYVKINNRYKCLYKFLIKRRMHLTSITKSQGIMSPAKMASAVLQNRGE